MHLNICPLQDSNFETKCDKLDGYISNFYIATTDYLNEKYIALTAMG
jgi:hypothetical protein